VINDYDVVESNANLAMAPVMLKVLLTLAIEMAVAVSAYIRGKAQYAKRYLTGKDYKTV